MFFPTDVDKTALLFGSRMETVLCATSNAANGILVHDLSTGARVHAYKESTTSGVAGLARVGANSAYFAAAQSNKAVIHFWTSTAVKSAELPCAQSVGVGMLLAKT